MYAGTLLSVHHAGYFCMYDHEGFVHCQEGDVNVPWSQFPFLLVSNAYQPGTVEEVADNQD